MVIPLINCGTSFLAGFAIFSVVGFMANQSGLPVDKVITSGVYLSFNICKTLLYLLYFDIIYMICIRRQSLVHGMVWNKLIRMFAKMMYQNEDMSTYLLHNVTLSDGIEI